jgi:hypothetical protein
MGIPAIPRSGVNTAIYELVEKYLDKAFIKKMACAQ